MDGHTLCIEASKSASNYLDYLNSYNKGVIETQVIKIQLLKPYEARLYLRSKLMRWEDVLIRVGPRLYNSSEIAAKRYDQDDKYLDVKWDNEKLNPFRGVYADEISVISDMKFLVKRVRDWYSSQAFLALPKCRSTVIPPMPELSLSPSDEQVQAYEGIFLSPLAYIWGAPGTGKTQFVLSRAVLAYHRLSIGPVLIVAPTNNAVEQTLRGVLSVFEEANVPFDYVLRLGVPSKSFYDKYPMVCEVASVEDEAAELQEQLKYYKRVVAYHEVKAWAEEYGREVSRHKDAVASTKRSILTETAKLNTLKFENKLHQARSASALAAIDDLLIKRDALSGFVNKDRSGLSLFFSRKKIEEARNKLSEVCASLEKFSSDHSAALNKISELKNQIESSEKAVSALEKELAREESRFKSLPGCPLMPSRSYSEICDYLDIRAPEYKDVTYSDALSRVNSIELRLSEIEGLTIEKRMQSATVIAATIDGYISRLSSNEDFQPVHIFLDEAAYCPLIKAATLLSKDAPLAMLGDHMQLPPVCEFPEDELAENANIVLWNQSAIHLHDLFTQDIFELFFQYNYEVQNDPYLPSGIDTYMLLNTHRFGEDLAAPLRDYVYPKDFRGREDLPTQVLYIDVVRSKGDAHKTSVSECLAIKEAIDQLNPNSFSVLTPYRAQLDLLKKHLDHENVFTIHGSQGREWDTVFLSVAASSNTKFISNKRLINTAVSRAKKQIIIVCDFNYWLNKTDGLISRLLRVAKPYEGSYLRQLLSTSFENTIPLLSDERSDL